MDSLFTWFLIAAALAAAPAIIEMLVGIVALLFRLIMGIVSGTINTAIGIAVRSGTGMSEREAALARASWGAVMLYAVLFEIQRMPDIDQLPENWRVWASVVLAVWG